MRAGVSTWAIMAHFLAPDQSLVVGDRQACATIIPEGEVRQPYARVDNEEAMVLIEDEPSWSSKPICNDTI